MAKKNKAKSNVKTNGTSEQFVGWADDDGLMKNLRNAVEEQVAFAEDGAYDSEGSGLEVKGDDELRAMERALIRSIHACRNQKQRYPLEVDLCYVQREIQVRQARAKAAEEYKRRLEIEEDKDIN